MSWGVGNSLKITIEPIWGFVDTPPTVTSNSLKITIEPIWGFVDTPPTVTSQQFKDHH